MSETEQLARRVAGACAAGEKEKQGSCICPSACDCENPEPGSGAALVSMTCPEHTDPPYPYENCPASGEHKNGAFSSIKTDEDEGIYFGCILLLCDGFCDCGNIPGVLVCSICHEHYDPRAYPSREAFQKVVAACSRSLDAQRAHRTPVEKPL